VRRQVLYQQFGDRDALLLEAAFDLARRELVSAIEQAPRRFRRATMLTVAHHFAGHRVFYRALLLPSAYVLRRSNSSASSVFTTSKHSVSL